jgi:hypothetical protein
LQPIILEGFNDNKGLLIEASQIKKLDYHIKKMFLFEFLIEKFLMDYLIKTNTDFSSLGTLRNEKGTSIHERLMTVLTTWSQQGLDSLQMLRLKLSS